MELLLDFANMQESDCGPEFLAALYRKHGVFHTAAGQALGSEADLRTRAADLVFSFTAENPMQGQLLGMGRAGDFVAPVDARWASILWPIMRDFRDVCRRRLDQFISGEVDLAFLGGILRNANISGWRFEASPHLWRPRVTYTYASRTIEDVIEIREFMEPFFFGRGEEFSRVRKCQNCGTYFVAKYKGKAFCSDKCRSSYHYRVAH